MAQTNPPLKLLKTHHCQFLGLVPARSPQELEAVRASQVRAAMVLAVMVFGKAVATLAYGRYNTQNHADISKHLATSHLDLQSHNNLHP